MIPELRIIIGPIEQQDEETRHYKALERIRSITTSLQKGMIYMPDSWREFGHGYKPPNADEVKSHFQPYGDKVARMIGEPDANMVEKWMIGDAEIPYSSWRLFLIMTGKVFS